MAKILVTKSGCYGVKDGKTAALENGEHTVTDSQAKIFTRSGKASLVLNEAEEEAKKAALEAKKEVKKDAKK